MPPFEDTFRVGTVRTFYNQIAGTGLERPAAMSDGLLAIAMTLILLELRGCRG